jgi:ornithine carbamoyltransferase
MSPKHFLQFADLSASEIEYLFERTRYLKACRSNRVDYRPLVGRSLAMLFDKHSTRTRVSFEAGMQQLGGGALFMRGDDTQSARGEPIEDTARVISSMVDAVMLRTYEQEMVERFAANSSVPVINGLTNQFHPCQILADVFTYVESHGSIRGKVVAWIGDANNVACTWVQAAQQLNFELRVAAPKAYQLQPGLTGPGVTCFDDPFAAVRGADVVSTDVWTSMGFEAEEAQRRRDFAPYQVNAELLRAAGPQVLFMHCLPAHRGEEVTDEVLRSSHSVVWREAENRLHTQKALLEYLILGRRD